MTLISLWNSFVQAGLPRRRAKQSFRLEAGLEHRTLLSAISGCQAIVEVTDPEAEPASNSEDVGQSETDTEECLSWCGVIDTSFLVDAPEEQDKVDQDTAEELPLIVCDGLIPNNELFLDPVDPAIEIAVEPVDGEVDPRVIRCFGLNPDALDVVEATDAPVTVEDPVDSTNPEVPTDPVDNPDVIFYSLGGGRGTDENGNIPPNFRGGHQQSRHDRRQARKQEKASHRADHQATVQQHKTDRAARHAGRRHR